MNEISDYEFIIEWFRKAQERATYQILESESNPEINQDYYLGMLDLADQAIMFLEYKETDEE